VRERAEALEADAGVHKLPDLLQMAFVADRRWMPEIEIVHRNPFALFHILMFTGSSFTTHASASAVNRVVQGEPPNLVVGWPDQFDGASGPYGLGILLVANVLVVASRALGWPPEDGVLAALDLPVL
jgi:hypothetical protein